MKKGRRTATKPKGIAATLLLGTILFAIMISGCSQPVKDYSYINLNRLKGWSENTSLTLNFDMVDTTNACELYIIGEIATKRTIEKEKGYPINITFIAPCGTMYRDSVVLPTNVVSDREVSRISHGIRVIEWPYRKNIYNKEPGQWSMVLTKGDLNEDYSNIIGLGVYCKQEKL